jgi:hypothetical protein
MTVELDRQSLTLEMVARTGSSAAPDNIAKLRLNLAKLTGEYLLAVHDRLCTPLRATENAEAMTLVHEYGERARDTRRIVAAHQRSWSAERTKVDWPGYCAAIVAMSELFAQRRKWEIDVFLPAAERLLMQLQAALPSGRNGEDQPTDTVPKR